MYIFNEKTLPAVIHQIGCSQTKSLCCLVHHKYYLIDTHEKFGEGQGQGVLGTPLRWKFLGRGRRSEEHGQGVLEDLLFLIQPRNEHLEKKTWRARGNQPPKLRSCLDGQPGPPPARTACPSAPPVAQRTRPSECPGCKHDACSSRRLGRYKAVWRRK